MTKIKIPFVASHTRKTSMEAKLARLVAAASHIDAACVAMNTQVKAAVAAHIHGAADVLLALFQLATTHARTARYAATHACKAFDDQAENAEVTRKQCMATYCAAVAGWTQWAQLPLFEHVVPRAVHLTCEAARMDMQFGVLCADGPSPDLSVVKAPIAYYDDDVAVFVLRLVDAAGVNCEWVNTDDFELRVAPGHTVVSSFAEAEHGQVWKLRCRILRDVGCCDRSARMTVCVRGNEVCALTVPRGMHLEMTKTFTLRPLTESLTFSFAVSPDEQYFAFRCREPYHWDDVRVYKVDTGLQHCMLSVMGKLDSQEDAIEWNPESVLFTPEGTLLVCDWTVRRCILEFTVDGEVISVIYLTRGAQLALRAAHPMFADIMTLNFYVPEAAPTNCCCLALHGNKMALYAAGFVYQLERRYYFDAATQQSQLPSRNTAGSVIPIMPLASYTEWFTVALQYSPDGSKLHVFSQHGGIVTFQNGVVVKDECTSSRITPSMKISTPLMEIIAFHSLNPEEHMFMFSDGTLQARRIQSAAVTALLKPRDDVYYANGRLYALTADKISVFE